MAIELSKPFVQLDPVRGLLAEVLDDCRAPKVCVWGVMVMVVVVVRGELLCAHVQQGLFV